MIDYETIRFNNKRMIGFGRYAGVVGAYNAFLCYGMKTNTYRLKSAHSCLDRAEMEKEFNKIIYWNFMNPDIREFF